MKIALDMDGCITEGRYLEPPRTKEMYMSLKPYDNDTIDVLTDIMYEHEVFIITARSEPRSDRLVRAWMATYDLPKNGATVIYNPFPMGNNEKNQLKNAVWKRDLFNLLGCDLAIDDSPFTWKAIQRCWLMDNPLWKENQELDTATRIKSWGELGAELARYNNTKSYA